MSRAGAPAERARRAKAEQRRQRHSQARSEQASEAIRTATHEAAHAVVAHALGRRVVYLRCAPKVLPAGHEHNPRPHPIVSAGFHLTEPRLADEINAAHEAGVPLTDEQTRWLRETIVISLAGPLVEKGLGWDAAEEAGASDFEQAGQTAAMLGRTETDKRGTVTIETTFSTAAQTAANTIITDLFELIADLGERLHADGELEADAIESVLSPSTRGSHRELLPE